MAELTKAAEDRLIGILRDVIRMVDDQGLDPSEAIVKCADDGSWSPHFLRRICESYNVGRQEAQRKTASLALDKFASFPLADADRVIGQLYPRDDTKQAAVASEYQAPPSWLPDLREKPVSVLTPLLEKAAAAEIPAAPSVTEKINAVHRTTKAAELANQQVCECKDKLRGALSKLGSYCRLSIHDRVPFALIEKVAQAYYPDEARLVLDYVHAKHCKDDKRAGADDFPPGRIDRNQRPFNLLTNCVNCAQKLAEAETQFSTAKQAGEQAFADYCEAKEQLFRPFPVALTPELGIFASETTSKTGGFGGIAMGAGVMASMKSMSDDVIKQLHNRPTPDQLVDKEWRALEDPGHDEELRKIRVQAMLTDLLANDEVISKHDPETVLTKFNELQGMMPSLSAQPATMRPYLRRALQGHIEPFESHEMAKLQQTFHPQESSGLELKSAFVLG